MEKVVHRISSLLILFTIGVSYSFWLLGINHRLVQPVFSDSAYWLGGMMLAVVLLNLKKLQRGDWILLALAAANVLLNLYTAGYRQATTLDMSIIPSVILLFVMACRVTPFDKLDQSLLLFISVSIMGLNLYRLFKHLYYSGLLQNFFTMDNSLKVIWINVNVIGAVLLFCSITSAILIKSIGIKYGTVFTGIIYFLGLLGTWGCQSRTSFLILLAFMILNAVLPKKRLSEHRSWLWGFLLIFLLAPAITYLIADSETINIFTGRENIWREFFNQWLSEPRAVLAGQKPFLYGPQLLSTHNSYLYLLCNFGVVGYLFLNSGLSYYILKLKNKAVSLTDCQISCLIAFFLVLGYCFMEDSLMVIQWVPVMFSYLGFAAASAKKKEQ